MQELFVGCEQAQKLESLGFDRKCFGWYNYGTLVMFGEDSLLDGYAGEVHERPLAPIYQQAFDWFRDEKDLLNHLTTHLNAWGEDGALETSYGYRIMIDKDGWKCDVWEQLSRYETYEEARQALLNKLIEIVENETKSKIN